MRRNQNICPGKNQTSLQRTDIFTVLPLLVFYMVSLFPVKSVHHIPKICAYYHMGGNQLQLILKLFITYIFSPEHNSHIPLIIIFLCLTSPCLMYRLIYITIKVLL